MLRAPVHDPHQPDALTALAQTLSACTTRKISRVAFQTAALQLASWTLYTIDLSFPQCERASLTRI